MLQTTVHPISAHGKMTEPALLRLLQPVTILAGVFLCSASLLVAAPRPVVFASFESQEEVSSWSTTGGATAGASGRYTSWFNKSLEVVFPGSGSPEIGTDKVPGDWQLHEALRFFCYSSLPAELLLTLKDEHGSQVERRIHLRRGPNHVQLELAGLGGIDLRRMESVHLSRPSGLGEITAWLDRFALDRFNSILARRGRMDITYRKDVVTPHRAFARPLAAGAVRCLLVPDVENGRAVVELAQRLDLDYEAVTLGSAFGTNIWGFGDFYHKRGRTFQEYPTSVFSLAYTYLADALLNGPHYDVIVIPGSRPWGEFPEPVRREIARRVSEGAGLVLVCPRFDPQYDNSDLDGLSPLVDVEKIVWMNPNNFIVEDLDKLRRAAWRKVQKPHYITRNVPLEAFPFELMQYARSRAAGGGEVLIETDEASSYPILAVRNHGKGRVVALSYGERGLIPRIAALRQVEVEYPYWEYMYSLLARCVVWAAGRESAASIENISLTRKGVAAIEVAGSRAGDAAPRELEVVFRDSFGERIDSSRVAVPAKGSGSLEVKLPADAPGGAVLVDARLIENGLVLDWGSLIGKIPQKARIDSIRFSAERFLPGEKITGRINLSGAEGTESLCSLELRDNHGRLLDQKIFTLEHPQGPESGDFRLDPSGALSHLVWVDCRLSAPDGRREDRRRAEVFFQRATPWDDYDVVMYLFGPEPMPGLWPTIERKLKEFHTTTLSSYPVELCKYANFSVQAQTRISGQESPDGSARDYYNKMKKDYLATGDKHFLVREFCLSDPEYLALEKRELERLCAPWVPFSPRSYYVYEEPSFTCYGDALDICFSPHTMRAMRTWLKGQYGSLEALNKVWGTRFASWDRVEPDDSRQAQERGNYASWADHRTFMEITYAGNYDYVARVLRQIDPNGITLNSGTQIVGPHNGCDYWRLNRIVGHLNPYTGQNQMDFHRTFGNGLKLSAGMGYGISGRDVLHRLYANLFEGCWAGCYVFWQYSVLDPDLTYCQSALDMKDGLDEVAGAGVARLMKNLPRGHDNIAIHYSMASAHGTWITDGRISEQVTYNTSDAFDTFTANRNGWVSLLKDLGYQYDFLAYEEIEKGGLEEGGYKVLILPLSVALSQAEVQAIEKFVEAGGTLVTDRFAAVMDEHCRWLDTGALDHVLGLNGKKKCRPGDFTSPGPEPSGINTQLKAHAYGKGRAVTLGFLLDNYPEWVRDGVAGKARKLAGSALETAGVRPPVRLETPDRGPVSGVTTASFTNGESTLLGILRSNEGELNRLDFSAILPNGAAHVYDLRKGTYLGYTDRIHLELSTGEPALFALLPRPPGRLTVEAPGKVAPGGSVHLSLSLDEPMELHDVALVEVVTPEGKRHELYSTRIDLDNSSGELTFPLALDDQSGRWMIRVTEVISGRRGEAFFTVSK